MYSDNKSASTDDNNPPTASFRTINAEKAKLNREKHKLIDRERKEEIERLRKKRNELESAVTQAQMSNRRLAHFVAYLRAIENNGGRIRAFLEEGGLRRGGRARVRLNIASIKEFVDGSPTEVESLRDSLKEVCQILGEVPQNLEIVDASVLDTGFCDPA